MTTGAGSRSEGTDYDVVPYLSLPIAYTDPSRLAAMGMLMGLDSPAPETATVAELGCAGGGNLIPMAARYPDARFMGFDLSARQVGDANRRAAELGLRNVRFEQADIARLDLPAASVDYLICHGVFSWVPGPVQEAILALAERCLRADGIAAVSYNVLPGWHLRSPVRDILLQAAGSGPPQERVARAREALKRLEREASPRHGYGAVMRAEAVRMARMPSSYLLGEFLAEHNAPLSFPDMLARARRHGLEFLVEADLSAGAGDWVARTARPDVATLTGGTRFAAEADLDRISGRPFRRSLFVRAAAAARLRPPTRHAVERLHVSANLTMAEGTNGHAQRTLRDGAGRTVTSAREEVRDVLARMARAFPATLPVRDLAGAMPAAAPVLRALLDLVGSGRATLVASPLETGRATDARPTAWDYARREAAAGQPHVTGRSHVTVVLPPEARPLVARLDGTRTRAQLARGGPKAAALAETLRLLERGAVLVGSQQDRTIAGS